MTGNPEMDSEFIKWLSTLGIGGILAGLMFVFYRKDVRQYTELWKTSSDQMMTIVKENTASNTKIITVCENIERNSIRKADIEFLIGKRIEETKRHE